MDNLLQNNKIYLEGTVCSELEFSHEMYGEGFYTFYMEVPRLSEAKDLLFITVSERLIGGMEIKVGSEIIVEGQLRSYNKFVDGANRLILTVFARNIEECIEKSKNPNQIFLNGFICKQPVYRTTPFGREIADLLLAVNRAYNKSDYIPTIAWGRNSRFCQELNVGDNIRIWGRLQSREYQKKISESEVVKKIAYEVSISKMEKVSEDGEKQEIYLEEKKEVEEEKREIEEVEEKMELIK
ncbi:single-stranded DNA-binding protein [Clostridium tetanomorphum]|uniref:Single-stranded DNA-binding protein n=1 Tax=Clostridium tetanomorphum TaxID=1553 RepID=A0A923ECZ8_CLOTT|nr:single-stranded DNA-binding protein [Clostridium tetanomorphum]KAJ50449.1 single-stranded DNA-binding protein [Clostridium tetanomorphum DSM 665]MBC2398238.1 single-stranded DNA-binding protein [Clostridium tetanomorphum]MBP1865643.1 single-stranded DNA-binding protein [Clostridium tetanomorphum]NRS85851.1 single-stranded DNA-binding protein [Clostridium tetanomorphum]NRZ96141.1 single-stranded DNA-binding protein [Clostridium tetanomorphum]